MRILVVTGVFLIHFCGPGAHANPQDCQQGPQSVPAVCYGTGSATGSYQALAAQVAGVQTQVGAAVSALSAQLGQGTPQDAAASNTAVSNLQQLTQLKKSTCTRAIDICTRTCEMIIEIGTQGPVTPEMAAQLKQQCETLGSQALSTLAAEEAGYLAQTTAGAGTVSSSSLGDGALWGALGLGAGVLGATALGGSGGAEKKIDEARAKLDEVNGKLDELDESQAQLDELNQKLDNLETAGALPGGLPGSVSEPGTLPVGPAGVAQEIETALAAGDAVAVQQLLESNPQLPQSYRDSILQRLAEAPVSVATAVAATSAEAPDAPVAAKVATRETAAVAALAGMVPDRDGDIKSYITAGMVEDVERAVAQMIERGEVQRAAQWIADLKKNERAGYFAMAQRLTTKLNEKLAAMGLPSDDLGLLLDAAVH